jgi:hypothetical protein
MPNNDFFERTDELAAMVGDGDLVGHFRVDQEYAAVQHEGGWLNFMGRYGAKRIKRHTDGQAPPSKFVENPLKENYERYYQNLADGVLDGTLIERMAENVEDQDRELRLRAPKLTTALSKSGSPSVTSEGDLVYHRPPEIGRLEA